MNTAERGHPPSRPQPGPPPAYGGPRRLPDAIPPGQARPDDGPASARAPGNAGGRPPGAAGSGAGWEPVTSRGPRRLAKPKPVRVSADTAGRPQKIGKREVDAVRESWLGEARWGPDEPLRRRYWEVVTGDGRDLVVFRDLQEGRWYAQR